MTPFFLCLSVVLTVIAHILVKFRSNVIAARAPLDSGYVAYLLDMLRDPFVILALFAGFGSLIAWFMTIRKMNLAYAYPFLALTFVLIPVCARLFLNEPLPPLQIAAGFIIMAGIALHAFSYQ
jgi:drug/metabolite transporter (DMT)-like permease